jgi:hypothetical protein
MGLIAAGFGVAIDYASTVTLSILGTLVLLGVLLFAMRAFVLWQKLAFIALAGFVILSYGFTNWTAIPGKPLQVGHLLLLGAVLLAFQGRRYRAAAFLDEPAILWWLLLVGLTVAHLVFDIPRDRTYAIRDASFVFEGLFMLLGYLWARQAAETKPFLIALAVLFLLNTAYALTYPISDRLVAISPVSGIFQRVPLLGSYNQVSFFLIAGSLYYLLVMPHVRAWPAALTLGLAALQAAWSFVFQDRTVYIETVVAFVVLMVFGGLRRGVRLAAVVAGSLTVFFVLMVITGSVIQGRVGEVGPNFLRQHVRSLLGDPDAPAAGTVQWRLDLLSELRERWTVSSRVMAIGEGFGQPLIDFENAANVVVRQPHNTHITVLIRLGALGFLVWLLMHWRILTSFLRSLRDSQGDPVRHDLALWLFLFYVIGIVFTTFQPWLEFSYGAIPFYFFVGFSLAMAPRPTGGGARARGDLSGPRARPVAGDMLS